MPRSRPLLSAVIGVAAVSSAARALPRSDMKPSGSVCVTRRRDYKTEARQPQPHLPHDQPNMTKLASLLFAIFILAAASSATQVKLGWCYSNK